MARSTLETTYISSQDHMNTDNQKGQFPGQTDTKTMTQSSDKSILFQRKRGDVMKLIFAISHLNFYNTSKENVKCENAKQECISSD